MGRAEQEQSHSLAAVPQVTQLPYGVRGTLHGTGTVVRGTETSVVRGTETSVVRGTETSVVRGTETSVVRGAEISVVRGAESSVVRGAVPVVRGTETSGVRDVDVLHGAGAAVRDTGAVVRGTDTASNYELIAHLLRCLRLTLSHENSDGDPVPLYLPSAHVQGYRGHINVPPPIHTFGQYGWRYCGVAAVGEGVC